MQVIRVMFVLLFICLPTLLLAQATQEVTENDSASSKLPTVSRAEIGNTKNVHQAGNLFFAGQFGPDDLQAIKDESITRVITLRTDGEIDWDEESALAAAGLKFIKVPFRSPDSLTDEVFDKVRELLNDKSQTTLFHCGSANRVGGVWLPFRVLDEGVDLETALKEAKEIGLRTAFIEEKALDYIARKQKPAVMNGESSVKPGINKSFVDPNLEVSNFLAKFEIESREVFVNRERILAACEITDGDMVADVGAGTGLFTRMFSTEVGEDGWIYAVDISPRLLEYINNDASEKKLTNITSVLCAENAVNLPPDSIDVMFTCDTYHHFEYPKSTLTSMYRALKEDGHLIVVDFERIEGKSREWIMGHVRAGKEVVLQEIRDAGFELAEEKKIVGLEENYFLVFRKK